MGPQAGFALINGYPRNKHKMFAEQWNLYANLNKCISIPNSSGESRINAFEDKVVWSWDYKTFSDDTNWCNYHEWCDFK